jgi:hypothetical protein
MPQHPLELLGGQASPEAPARVLLGSGDELSAETLSEEAIVPQATSIVVVTRLLRFGHAVTIRWPSPAP